MVCRKSRVKRKGSSQAQVLYRGARTLCDVTRPQALGAGSRPGGSASTLWLYPQPLSLAAGTDSAGHYSLAEALCCTISPESLAYPIRCRSAQARKSDGDRKLRRLLILTMWTRSELLDIRKWLHLTLGERHMQQFADALKSDDSALLSDFTEAPNSPAVDPQHLNFGNVPNGPRVRKISALSDFAPVNLRVKRCAYT